MDCKKEKGCNDRKKQRVYVNKIYVDVDGDCCDELCEQVEANTEDVAGLKEKVSVNEQSIAVNAGNIQKNSGDIANLEPRVSKNEDDIEELQNRADVTDEKLSLSENRIALNEDNITNLIDKTTGMKGSITGLTARVENNEVGIGLLQGGLEETNMNVAELDGKVSTNKDSIDALDVRVGSAEDDIKERYTKTEVNTLLDNKAVKSQATPSDDGLMSKEDKIKIDGIAPGAEVNQNAFSFIDADGIELSADKEQDVVTIAGGKNISVTGDVETRKVSIDLSGSVDADTLDGLHLSDIQMDYNAQLDNKADKSETFKIYRTIESLGIIRGSETMTEIINAMPDNSMALLDIYSEGGYNFTEYPNDRCHVFITKRSKARVKVESYTNAAASDIRFWVGNTYNKNNDGDYVFSGWCKISTAKQPTKYAIPLSTGIVKYSESTHENYYYKNDFGEVKVVLQITKSTPFTANEVVATLPVGFRPSGVIEMPAILGNSTSAQKSGTTAGIDINGKITLNINTDSGISASYAWVYFEFLAA